MPRSSPLSPWRKSSCRATTAGPAPRSAACWLAVSDWKAFWLITTVTGLGQRVALAVTAFALVALVALDRAEVKFHPVKTAERPAGEVPDRGGAKDGERRLGDLAFPNPDP